MKKKNLIPGRFLHPGEHVKIWPKGYEDWMLGLLVGFVPNTNSDYDVFADGVSWILDRSQIFVDDEVPEQQKDLSSFSSMAFPVVRRVFPQLLAQELVSIQPMTMPVGQLFYLDYKYGSGTETKDEK